ncbi:Rha family transcriptional regulator [Vibrio sp. TBV020]|uniref:Rha family transcriptional regulator n=1 Tax=Vibrio sp. TBV020 TaxID=3137398 RepID=UPI0038CD19B1
MLKDNTHRQLVSSQSNSQPLTMSHREIANLTNTRPDNVKRTIDSLASKNLITFTQTEEKPTSGRPGIAYHVNEKDSYVVVARLSPEFTKRLVDRWQELEAQVSTPLPNFSDPAEAARAWAAEFERKQIEIQRANEAESEVNRLQGVCNAVTAQFASGMTPPAFCKQLNGVNIQQVNNYLIKIGALIRTKAGLEPTAYHRDRYFKVSFNAHGGKNRAVVCLTLKGAKWLYSHYINRNLPMKKDWDNRTSHILFTDS